MIRRKFVDNEESIWDWSLSLVLRPLFNKQDLRGSLAQLTQYAVCWGLIAKKLPGRLLWKFCCCNHCMTFIFGFISEWRKMLAWRMKMSGLRPGARTRNIGRWSVQRARAERGERREDQEAAGFARKLDNTERGRPTHGSLFVATFVLSGSNKTQNSSRAAAANTLAALS